MPLVLRSESHELIGLSDPLPIVELFAVCSLRWMAIGTFGIDLFRSFNRSFGSVDCSLLEHCGNESDNLTRFGIVQAKISRYRGNAEKMCHCEFQLGSIIYAHYI